MFILFKENLVPIKYIITFFLTDFMIRVFINTKLLILLAFIAFMFLTVYLMNDRFSEKLYDLLGNNSIEQSK